MANRSISTRCRAEAVCRSRLCGAAAAGKQPDAIQADIVPGTTRPTAGGRSARDRTNLRRFPIACGYGEPAPDPSVRLSRRFGEEASGVYCRHWSVVRRWVMDSGIYLTSSHLPGSWTISARRAWRRLSSPRRLSGRTTMRCRRTCDRRCSRACVWKCRWDAAIGVARDIALAVENRAASRALKPIGAVVDGQSLLSAPMLRLTHWMADHYLCPLGQVLDAVIPAGVRGQAGTREQVFLSVPSRARRARLSELRLLGEAGGGAAGAQPGRLAR